MTIAPSTLAADGPWPLLELHRARAERLLNSVRAVVLLLLAAAALVYAPTLPHALNLVNVFVLALTLAWTFAQWVLFSRSERLPGWLAVANPMVDITAVTVLVGGYGFTQSAALALHSPMLFAYFAILAARPIASSTRVAAAAAVLATVEYGVLVTLLVYSGRAVLAATPIGASAGAGLSLLDEGAKVLLIAVAGGIATYATAWHERLLVSYARQQHDQRALEGELASARLQALRHQLQPHFLFNTLNTITALISTDPRTAERVLAGLSALLRALLRESGDHEVPLMRELDMLGRYVEIQQIRFPDRVRVEMRVSDDAYDALVPNLILQPLVENSIRHGLAPRAAGGHVVVRAERVGEWLRLEVTDDGVGAAAARGAAEEGIGLGNTRARLKHLYGDRHEMHVEAGEAGGFAVRIALPYHVADIEADMPVLEGAT